MTETLAIDALSMSTVYGQAQSFYGAFATMLAVIAGIALGAYVWRRLRGAASR